MFYFPLSDHFSFKWNCMYLLKIQVERNEMSTHLTLDRSNSLNRSHVC